MPRCYLVKKGAPPPDTEPPLSSPTEASVAPPDQQANTESPQNAGTAAEYAELRSALLSERSAADTEAAHELLSLAAGVPPLPPTVLTVLRPPEPVIPVYTYTLQPTTIYIVSDEPPEPMYHAVQMPMQQIEYTIDQPQVNYVVEGYPAPLPLQYHPPSGVVFESEPAVPATLTTITIEEVSTDSEPEPHAIQVPVIEPPLPVVEPPPPVIEPPSPAIEPPPPTVTPTLAEPDLDSDDDTLSIVTTKEKQGKYDCSECGKRYASSSNLSRHKQTHRSLDSNSAKRCGECGKAYVSMPALAMHVLTHRMGHVCGVCGKQFSRPWLLRGHLRSHTGEKPFNCAACGKAFADRSNLRAHLHTHSSDKKYECPRCNKSFALKSYLNKHQEAACTRGDDDGAAA